MATLTEVTPVVLLTPTPPVVQPGIILVRTTSLRDGTQALVGGAPVVRRWNGEAWVAEDVPLT